MPSSSLLHHHFDHPSSLPDWDMSDDELTTTASDWEESSNSCFTCSEPSSDEEASVSSEELGLSLIVGRWTTRSVERHRRYHIDGWEDWRYFTGSERFLMVLRFLLGFLLQVSSG